MRPAMGVLWGVLAACSPDFDQSTASNPLLAGQTVLSSVAAAAGSRDWRVAYHPYPPDLLGPEFSPDDWPRVTYGNLGALQGWLASQWPGSAAATDVHLTESGVNSLTYECEVAGHNLLTADAGCEGLPALGPVGWIHDAPGTGRVALYRCRVSASGDHFVSESPSCEGHAVEQILGYAVQ